MRKINQHSEKQPENNSNVLDKQIVLNYQQIITYSAFLITFGASLFTFFKAIPKIESLDDKVNALNLNVEVFKERVDNIKATMKLSVNSNNSVSDTSNTHKVEK